MNILIPDSWLRDHLKTPATPEQLKEYLSLSGPSVERVNDVNGETVYDIEITTNRVDAYSVRGIAREAHAILPEYGIASELLTLPSTDFAAASVTALPPVPIKIRNEAGLCRRIIAVLLRNVTIAPSPDWMEKRLELAGQRPLNTIIDITNYVMWEMGHPVHAFDYDRLTRKTIIVREAKKGESLVTLDGKKHTLQGGEIVFDDGTGEIIDLPGIMGTSNTVVTPQTKNVLLFIENSDPVKIRLASMGLAIRTQAAVINEKHPDPALALPALKRAARLAGELAGAAIGSRLLDIGNWEKPVRPVTLRKSKLIQYLGTDIADSRVKGILTRLGCTVKSEKSKQSGIVYTVLPAGDRAEDMAIKEDVIEEVARIYGYHKISSLLPPPPPVAPAMDAGLEFEAELKNIMLSYGFTELFSYSMMSEADTRIMRYDTGHLYRIANPLTADMVYMRPSLLPGLIKAVETNKNIPDSLLLFELNMIYRFRTNDLPAEIPALALAATGPDAYRRVKGTVEALLIRYGIGAEGDIDEAAIPYPYDPAKSVIFGQYGVCGIPLADVRQAYGVSREIAVAELSVGELLKHRFLNRTYVPTPKYPPAGEDITFIVPPDFRTGPFLKTVPSFHPLVTSVTLIDTFGNARTFHITYLNPRANLTAGDIREARNAVIRTAASKFALALK